VGNGLVLQAKRKNKKRNGTGWNWNVYLILILIFVCINWSFALSSVGLGCQWLVAKWQTIHYIYYNCVGSFISSSFGFFLYYRYHYVHQGRRKVQHQLLLLF
jgi:uncharacterized BrkB/YihY/UPF0761 family membrane protein